MKLQPPKLIKEFHPIHKDSAQYISTHRISIKHALSTSKSGPLLFITGPCSIHDIPSSIEYAQKLAKMQKQVSSDLLLVMRCHVEKPRTNLGWKGFLYNPHFDPRDNLLEGIKQTRTLFDQISQLNIPIATEFLSPILAPYFEDFVSLGLIGSRSAPSPLHRYFASYHNFAFGFKNPCSGNLETLANALVTSASSHSTTMLDDEGSIVHIETQGNPDSISILRGEYSGPNYDKGSIDKLCSTLKNYNLPQRYLVDCSHQNSRYNPAKQKDVFEQTLQYQDPRLKGLMLESHIHGGSQSIQSDGIEHYGVSVTDSCLSWEETKELILKASDMLENRIDSKVTSTS